MYRTFRRISRPLIAYFCRKANPHRPFPLFGNAHARPDMVAHPVISVAGIGRSKDIKSHLENRRKAMRDLNGLVPLVIGRTHPVHDALRSAYRKIVMQLHHGVARFNGLRPVNLNFVVFLGAQDGGTQEDERDGGKLNVF